MVGKDFNVNSPKQEGSIEDSVELLSDDQVMALHADWSIWARPEQRPPAGDWITWLLMGGRGSGKTRAGSEWINKIARGDRTTPPTSPIAIVGETIVEARNVMIEGPSGVLTVAAADFRPKFEKSNHRLIWPNGTVAQLMTASDPDSFRGPQFAAAWSDEIAKWPDAETAWDMLQFGLRLGDRPRQIATTTPKPTQLLKRLLKDPHCKTVTMRTRDNEANLAPQFLDQIVGRYEGTRLGRQELDGEFIEDREGALWTNEMIISARHKNVGPRQRTLVAIDPSVRASGKGDACGIIVAANSDDDAQILADGTLKKAAPLVWAQKAVQLFHTFEADAIVAEVNQGGDLVTQVIRQVDHNIPVIPVTATRGKWLRAEPVAALYARGKVAHAAHLEALEAEMLSFDHLGKSNGRSPDRLDAAVWALNELMLQPNAPRIRKL